MATPTTYKDLIGIFQTICDQHLAVKFFNWSTALSDIEVNQPDYPEQQYIYVFLNPQTVTFTQGYAIYSANLIVMDLARKNRDAVLEVHDTTLSVMQDILAKIRLTTWNELDIQVQSPITCTPFVESQKQSTAGWSANLQIVTKNPLDLCNAAFIEY
jgi:hypothetical protein